jgi:hypothetical protein
MFPAPLSSQNKVIPLPKEICVDIDIIAYQSYLSIPRVKDFIACIKSVLNTKQAITAESKDTP